MTADEITQQREEIIERTRECDELTAMLAKLEAENGTMWSQLAASREMVVARDREVAELAEWKRQAIVAMPDFQKIGKLLAARIGEDIPALIVPALEYLTQQVRRQAREVDSLKAQLTDGNGRSTTGAGWRYWCEQAEIERDELRAQLAKSQAERDEQTNL